MPQCFAEPENASQVENWHIILDFFLLIFGFFSINFFIFGSFNRLFCQKSVIMATSLR